MSSDVMAIQTAEVPGRPWVETLHQWATTVDHKRLGILYILYALVMLIIGGIEATIIRIQLMHPHNDFVSPQVFNRMFTMHGTTTQASSWPDSFSGGPSFSPGQVLRRFRDGRSSSTFSWLRCRATSFPVFWCSPSVSTPSISPRGRSSAFPS
jgi:hypothetical protein